jgi:hypothetical protein
MPGRHSFLPFPWIQSASSDKECVAHELNQVCECYAVVKR